MDKVRVISQTEYPLKDYSCSGIFAKLIQLHLAPKGKQMALERDDVIILFSLTILATPERGLVFNSGNNCSTSSRKKAILAITIKQITS